MVIGEFYTFLREAPTLTKSAKTKNVQKEQKAQKAQKVNLFFLDVFINTKSTRRQTSVWDLFGKGIKLI